MKKTILIILGIILLILISIGIFCYSQIITPASKQEKNIAFEVGENQTTREIANNLKEKNIIKNTTVFTYYSLLSDKNILPGIYYLSPDMKMSEILDILDEGKVSEKKATIPEGWRREQIAQKLADEGIIDANIFLANTKDLEGYLFPDTYQFGLENTPEEVTKKFTDNFKAQTSGLNITKERLILASIIEREAKHDEDRANIAGVYQNRLDLGMNLGADPTIQYAKGDWNTLTKSDFVLDSPYNTYIYEGLPPTPICNPGIESIKAAINPAQHDYYYFINLADGTTIFSKTLEEHNTNIEKYRDKM